MRQSTLSRGDVRDLLFATVDPTQYQYAERLTRTQLITVHIWYAWTERVPDAAWPGWRRWLRDEELAEAENYRSCPARAEFLVGRALMRSLLSRQMQVEPCAVPLGWTSYGKPVWGGPEPDVFFNLAHTRGAAVCAFTRHSSLGIDLERCDRRVNLDIAARYFAPEEVAALRRLEPRMQARRFLELWTMKEAFIKAVGTGLAMPLESFACDLDSAQARLIRCRHDCGPPESWHLVRLRLGAEFLGALCLHSPSSSPVTCLWHEWRERPAEPQVGPVDPQPH
ncbi:MAG: 4'-phosphopantetheinyl transferase [Pirellulaceae bacterium]|nr:MAG: 4'-phosphopantetheinyl transferase [Pirellulaceae bacterium]